MVRRLILVGFFVLVEQGSLTQLVLANMVASAFLVFQVQAGPFKSLADDYLAMCCSFSLVVYMLCCLMFKVATLTELQTVRERLPPSLAKVFTLPAATLTQLLVVATLASLGRL